MALRFRKSIKLMPGVKFNIGKRSTGLSFGVNGLRYTVNSKGRRTSTIGAPGTGLSYVSTSGGKGSSSHKRYSSAKARRSALAKERQKAAADKEKQKRLEMEEARAAVEEYEARIEAITTIHKTCEDFIDWVYILSIPKPFTKGNGPNATTVHGWINNYKPGFIAKKFPSREEAKRKSLEKQLQLANVKDNKIYDEWETLHDTAERILSKDTDLMLDVIEEMTPLDDLLEYGSGFEISFVNDNIVEVEFDIMANDVIPTESLSLTATGKLSVRSLPIGKRLDLMQDYVCSCVLRIARDMFAILPVNNVLIHAKDSFIDTSIGNAEAKDVLSVAITRERLDRLNFEAIDPSDAMQNFVHTMKFLKTKGFQPVSRVEFKN